MVRTPFLLLALLLAGGYKPVRSPELKTPLVLTVKQQVGMAPLTVQMKVRAVGAGEVCVVVEGPESMQSCRTLQGITWTLDFTLRAGGCYAVFAMNQTYRTPAVKVNVVGRDDGECEQ